MSRFYTFTALASVGIHCSYVNYNNQLKKKSTFAFKLGSADDIIMDNLQTGDLIIFNRIWYKYYIPTALMIFGYKYFFDADFDHCGIIVTNNGIPYVFEITPMLGYKLRRFDKRVCISSSDQILIIPLIPRSDNIESEKAVQTFVAEKLYKVKSNEIFENCKCLANYVINFHLSGTSDVAIRTNNNFGITVNCPSAKLILETYEKLGIEISDENKFNLQMKNNIDLKSFIKREISFVKTNRVDEKILLSPSDVYIRTH
jgi:hypothetical protein